MGHESWSPVLDHKLKAVRHLALQCSKNLTELYILWLLNLKPAWKKQDKLGFLYDRGYSNLHQAQQEYSVPNFVLLWDAITLTTICLVIFFLVIHEKWWYQPNNFRVESLKENVNEFQNTWHGQTWSHRMPGSSSALTVMTHYDPFLNFFIGEIMWKTRWHEGQVHHTTRTYEYTQWTYSTDNNRKQPKVMMICI